MSSTAAPLDPTSLAASSRTRTLFCGLGSGAFAGLVGNFALTATGGLPGTPIQPLHVSLAALGTSVVGAFVLRALSARTPRAGAILVGAAIALAALATLKVGLTASEVHFVGTAAWVHFTVAVCGSGALGLSLRGTSTSGRGTVPMSIAAVATSLAAQLADLKATHVYNPAWPPHARYHGVLFICLLTGVGLLALALTWTPRSGDESGDDRVPGANALIIVPYQNANRATHVRAIERFRGENQLLEIGEVFGPKKEQLEDAE